MSKEALPSSYKGMAENQNFWIEPRRLLIQAHLAWSQNFQVIKKANHDQLLEEQRRSFYVAITRMKHKAFLITEKGNESSFRKEITDSFTVWVCLHFEMRWWKDLYRLYKQFQRKSAKASGTPRWITKSRRNPVVVLVSVDWANIPKSWVTGKAESLKLPV